MSSALTPYAIDLEAVRRAVGSGDEALLSQLLRENKAAFAEADEMEADENIPFAGKPNDALLSLQADLERLKTGTAPDPSGALAWFLNDEPTATEEEPPMAEVMRLWISGKPLKGKAAAKHTVAFRAICRHFGKPLPCQEWSELKSGSIPYLQAEFERAGLPAKALGLEKHLLNRGAPVSPKGVKSIPDVGYLERSELEALTPVLGRANISRMEPETRTCFVELQGWVSHCLEKGLDLVTFAG